MARLEFDQVSKVYGDGTRAVDNLDLQISDGEFMVLVGPSGCGKTTALRMVAGLEDISGGVVKIGDRVVNGLSPKSRDIAMVFQSYALYPHLSVYDNIAFPLKIAKTPKDEIRRRVAEAARILDLEPHLKRKPRQLSGGQRQRVAMGRSIIRHPQVFLMDEPLSNLDAQLRIATRAEIATLQRNLGVTTLYVTHDQVEAMTLGDRVAVMKDGVLQQCDTPRMLYEQPANAFVAGFIGSPPMNLVEGTVDPGGIKLGSVVIPVDRPPKALGERVTVGLRPESLALVSPGGGLPAVIGIVEELGAEAFVYAELDNGASPGPNAPRHIIARVEPNQALGSGELIHLGVKDGSMLFFDVETGAAIRA